MYNLTLSERELTCITLSISGAEFLYSRTVPFFSVFSDTSVLRQHTQTCFYDVCIVG